MASLQAADIADLITTTLDDLGEMKMTDIMSTYQNTIIAKRLVKKGKITFDAGPNVQFNLITGHNDSAREVGMYYTAIVNPTNVMTTGEVPWKHYTFNWAIERRELAINRSPRKIVDLIKTRRYAAMGAWVMKMESHGWRNPNPTTQADRVLGIPHWIVKSNTAITTNDGFNGATPSGYTTVAGIDPTSATVSPKWSNFAQQYTNVTKEDLVDKMWNAMDLTDFQPIVDSISTYDTGDDYGIYTTRAVRNSLKGLLEAQNEDLGFDLDPVGNKMAFRRTPITWVKELDSDTTGVMYGIYWGTFHAMGLRGEWMHETVFPSHSNQPTVAATHTDCTLNFYCTDRRRNFVLATDTTMPA